MNILILGSNERSVLTFIRSLNKNLYNKLFICRNSKNKNVSCFSKFIESSNYVSLQNVDIAFHHLIRIIEKHSIEALIIFDDAFASLVYDNYEKIGNHCRIIGPSKQSWEKAVDKYNIRKLCDGKSLHYPETKLLQKKSFDKNLDDYVYLKPRFSSVIYDKKIERLSVLNENNEDRKRDFISDHINKVDIVCQKKIEGQIIGLNLLAKKGEILSLSGNKRLHQPRGGGGSSYRESFKPDNTVIEICHQISRELKWDGVMMIELLKTESKYFLIEINPRFWGSLSLTVFSGHDICNNLIKSQQNKSLLKDKYKNVRTRHLAKDIAWITQNYSFRNLANLIASPLQIILKKEKWDVESLTDPMPMFVQPFLILKKLFYKKHFVEKIAALLPTYRKVIKYFDKKNYYIFMCKGNINRSVFCEYYLHSKGYKNVSSCGYLNITGRKISPNTRKLINESEIVTKHKSRYIDNFDNDENIIVAMDNISYEIAKRKKFKNVYLISKKGINDPHGKAEIFFQNMKREIINEFCKKDYR